MCEVDLESMRVGTFSRDDLFLSGDQAPGGYRVRALRLVNVRLRWSRCRLRH